MILSNNPRTYISITKYIDEIYVKYAYRWAGPSSVHTYTLRLGLWTKNGIKNF